MFRTYAGKDHFSISVRHDVVDINHAEGNHKFKQAGHERFAR